MVSFTDMDQGICRAPATAHEVHTCVVEFSPGASWVCRPEALVHSQSQYLVPPLEAEFPANNGEDYEQRLRTQADSVASAIQVDPSTRELNMGAAGESTKVNLEGFDPAFFRGPSASLNSAYQQSSSFKVL